MKEKDLNVVMGVISDPIKNVYRIENRKDEEEILLPAIKECVKEVDIEAGTMVVHLLAGLRELNM